MKVRSPHPENPASVGAGTLRKPRGYAGINHETIGSDILALLQSVLMPEHVLGKELVQSLREIEAQDWYPISRLLQPLERLDAVLGESSLRKTGWGLFRISHEDAVRRVAKSVRDIVYGIDGMYHRANRGEKIGDWRVVSFENGEAVLEKTTPHHCIMEEGILESGCRAVGVTPTIFQSKCFRRGDDICRFVLRSHITDARWGG